MCIFFKMFRTDSLAKHSCDSAVDVFLTNVRKLWTCLIFGRITSLGCSLQSWVNLIVFVILMTSCFQMCGAMG